MIFQKTWQQVLDGTKTQTRRPVKPGEYAIVETMIDDGVALWQRHEGLVDKNLKIVEVRFANRQTKWRVGQTLAVQPGRGKKAVGRIRITKIRRERLTEITPQAAKAEGADPYYANGTGGRYVGYYEGFARLWDSIYKTTPYRWGKNPEVWVLEFERSL